MVGVCDVDEFFYVLQIFGDVGIFGGGDCVLGECIEVGEQYEKDGEGGGDEVGDCGEMVCVCGYDFQCQVYEGDCDGVLLYDYGIVILCFFGEVV